MKANCAGIPIEYKLTYNKERRQIRTTRLPATVKQTVKNAYGDSTRSDDAAPLAVYYTTDRAGYRLLSVTLFRRGFLGLFLIDRGSICHIDPSSSES